MIGVIQILGFVALYYLITKLEVAIERKRKMRTREKALKAAAARSKKMDSYLKNLNCTKENNFKKYNIELTK